MKRALRAGAYAAPVILTMTAPVASVAAATPAPGSGFSFAPATAYTVADPRDVAVGDCTGDGKPDLVVVGLFVGAVVLLNQGNGTFTQAGTYPTLLGNTYLGAVGDFNRDGKRDIAIAGFLGGQRGGLGSLFRGNGDGTFTAAGNFGAGLASGLGLGDFTGDGKADLIVTNFDNLHGSFTLGVFPDKGDGTFDMGIYTYGVGLTSLAIADFNGDGRLDIAGTAPQALVAQAPVDAVSVVFGTGNGMFATPVTYPVGFAAKGVAVGDFNRDGKPDLAVVGDGGVAVLLNTGSGAFASPVTYLAGDHPTRVAVADFNGDGKLDLAATNNGGGSVSILPGKGDGTFGAPVNIPAGAAPEQIAVGDFNGDGKPDIVVTSSTTNSVRVLLNTT